MDVIRRQPLSYRYENLSDDPLWYKDAVFYELNVRAFADSNGDGHGDFRGMIEHVDHVLRLGVNCVWLLPFYPSPLRDDGYDIADYYNVAEKYGTLDDFKEMLDVYHRAGIRVVADLVVNHTSDQHPWFIESRSSRDNAKRDWYVWSDTDQRYLETRIIFVDTEDSNWSHDDSTGQFYWHRFYREQPDLNFDNPAVREEILNIMRYWLDMNLDGFRVDAIPYLYERDGTNNENLPETHQYLKQMRKLVEEEFPGRILLAEANQWPEELLPYLEPDEFHMAFHFPIMPRLYMGVRKGEREDIVDILARTPAIPDQAQWCFFLRNHDELTLEMVTWEQREWMWQEYAPDPRMKLNLGIRRRLMPLLDNDQRKLDLMNALLLSLPGSPIIYNGDEIGMGDDIWLPDRNGVRTPMQWNDGKNGGFSTADSTYLPVIDDEMYGCHRINVAAQENDPNSTLNRLRHQIHIRSQHHIFGRGKFAVIDVPEKAIFAYERTLMPAVSTTDNTASYVLVVANLSDEVHTIDLGDYNHGAYTDLLSGHSYTLHELTLEPYQCMWLMLI